MDPYEYWAHVILNLLLWGFGGFLAGYAWRGYQNRRRRSTIRARFR
jgi:hypothetical protein